MTDPTGVLTAVTVTNGSAINSITSAMSSTLTSSGNIKAVTVTLTADGGTIKVNNVAVTSGTAFIHDFSDSKPITIKVTLNDTTTTYTLTVIDAIHTSKLGIIQRMGWFAARSISGDLDAYAAGGLTLPLGNFTPRFVINVQVSEGFIGEYDLETKKLKVYSAAGTEAQASALKTARYNVILME